MRLSGMHYFVLVVVMALAWPAPARACSCAEETALFPLNGATDVPTNTKIWVHGTMALFDRDSDHPFTLHLASPGREVPGRTLELAPRLFVFIPDEQLAPGVTYQVDPSHGVSDSIWFTVGAAEDVSAPELPVFSVERGEADEDNGCGSSAFATVHVEAANAITVMDVGKTSALAVERISGHVSDGFGPGEDSTIVGFRGCSVTTWSEAKRGATTTVRLGRFDMAGNFSGWTDSQDVEIHGGCGCSVTSESSAWRTAIGILCLVLLGRDARRRKGTRG